MTSLPSTKSVCFTGHRALPRASIARLEALLLDAIRAYAKEGYTDFLAGGAVGFDMLAAVCVLNLKAELPQLKLHLILPCQNHTAAWGERELAIFARIRKRADRVFLVTDAPYSAGCMQARNRYLVDHASLCLAYLRTEKGGTAFTVHYAKKKGVTVRNLASEL